METSGYKLAPDQTSNEVAIQTLFDQLSEAWDKGDANSYAALFTEDADYIAFDGSLAKGQTAIADMHRPFFEGILKGSRLHGEIVALRFLVPEVALLHSKGAVLSANQEKPARRAISVQTMVAVKGSDQWRFAAFQNTRYRPFTQTILGKLIMRFAPRNPK